ncbi:MAG: hypothetical protein ABH871_06590 [Pseudomonadota bacterium]
MSILKSVFTGKGWLAYGSYMGGALGALLLHLNQILPVHSALTFGMPMGLGLAVALGMIGGLIGGVIGCFVGARLAREGLVMGVGESLGVGLLNGFLVGTAVGIILGFIHRWWPGIATMASVALLIIAIVFTGILLTRAKVR